MNTRIDRINAQRFRPLQKKRHIFLFLVGVALYSPIARITAQSSTPQLQLQQEATSVRITVAGSSAARWPTIAIGGMPIPAQLTVVRLAHNTPALPRVASVVCRPWAGTLRPSTRPIPQTNGEVRPDLAASSTTAIPTTPISLLREGRSRGQRLAVFAVAGVMEREGTLCQLTRLDATIPGAQLLDDARTASTAWQPTIPHRRIQPPTTRRSRSRRWAARMQRIRGADLAPLGTSRLGFDPSRLQLHRNGHAVALQLLGAEDGRIDAGDELRFFAPAPGDRWNQADTYWLTVRDTPGRRIERRDTPPGSASQRTTGQEAGRWQPRTIYDSTLPGPDGDHWFADELRNGTGQHEQITIPLTTTLPLAAGPVTLTIASSAYTAGSHELVITAGNATARRRWEGTGNWTQTVTLDTEVTSATIALLPGTTADSTLIDHVTWQRPVQLQVSAAGAIFSGATGPWRYQLTGSSDDQVLYT